MSSRLASTNMPFGVRRKFATNTDVRHSRLICPGSRGSDSCCAEPPRDDKCPVRFLRALSATLPSPVARVGIAH